MADTLDLVDCVPHDGGMTTNEFLAVDWSDDSVEDLAEYLNDYLAPLVADSSLIETPNGAQLAEFCYQIRDEFARRHMNVILPFSRPRPRGRRPSHDSL